jgi:hypothetical protein
LTFPLPFNFPNPTSYKQHFTVSSNWLILTEKFCLRQWTGFELEQHLSHDTDSNKKFRHIYHYSHPLISQVLLSVLHCEISSLCVAQTQPAPFEIPFSRCQTCMIQYNVCGPARGFLHALNFNFKMTALLLLHGWFLHEIMLV